MSVNRHLLGLVLLLLLTFGSSLYGAGFALYQSSARGHVLGGLTAHGDDVATLFYNPAGITELKDAEFMFGVTLISPDADVELTNIYTGNTSKANTEEKLFAPPHIYYSRPLRNNLWLGLTVGSRFGLSSEFERDFPGRYNSYNAEIVTMEINPNIAWKVNDKFSLAFGIRAMYMDVTLESATDAGALLGLPPNNPDTDTYDVYESINGDSLGYGFDVSAFYKASERWSFGVSYFSEVNQEVDNGVVNFERPDGLPDGFFMDSPGVAELDLPAFVFLGASYRAPSKRWSLGLGAVYTGWESFKEIRLEFDRPIVVIPGLGAAVTESVSVEDWRDAWKWSIGYEFMLNEAFDIQTGFIYDDSPIREENLDYRLPTNDRIVYAVGVRYKPGVWTFDLGINYLQLKDRTIPDQQLEDGVLPSEVSNGEAWLIGMSASRKF
ncbi:Outer membrane protein transport protein [Sulfidibacter corallicola]|uniref:Outer membrane protein transport protein n=1 Tax=Sulfidibacter corallicola TaxID=2818388 RepID=A0A8A4TPY3_SULCO|nr:outer membrane protein transport protein [Sulfidibacter corallicola]QTD52036.1 outer membrane protein transport protein [Sulfidibacter corallicola]